MVQNRSWFGSTVFEKKSKNNSLLLSDCQNWHGVKQRLTARQKWNSRQNGYVSVSIANRAGGRSKNTRGVKSLNVMGIIWNRFNLSAEIWGPPVLQFQLPWLRTIFSTAPYLRLNLTFACSQVAKSKSERKKIKNTRFQQPQNKS